MIEIKRWDNGEVIHSGDFKSVKECLEDGVRQGVNFYRAKLNRVSLDGSLLDGASLISASLISASLDEASLDEASLYRANLDGVNLSEAKEIIQFGPMNSSGRIAYAVNHGDRVMIKAGCFWDTTEALRERVKDDHERWDYLMLCDWAEKRFLGGEDD